MNHDKLLALIFDGRRTAPPPDRFYAEEIITQFGNASYDKGYQDASEKAGHHFIYEVIPAEKEASREAGIREAIAAVEKMTVDPNFSAHWTDGYAQAKGELLLTLSSLLKPTNEPRT
jgi:hypothetical protein